MRTSGRAHSSQRMGSVLMGSSGDKAFHDVALLLHLFSSHLFLSSIYIIISGQAQLLAVYLNGLHIQLALKFA